MADNGIISKIAENIKAMRLKKNLTIQQLAAKTKVTKGLLSKIENSRTIPSLPVFVQILNSLDISFQDFFQDINLQNQQKYLLIRKDEFSASTPEGEAGFAYRNIIVEKLIPSSTFSISLLNIKHDAGRHEEMFPGYRFDHIISGNCEYRLSSNEVICAGPGDSIYFNDPVAHPHVNTSDKHAIILAIHFRF